MSVFIKLTKKYMYRISVKRNGNNFDTTRKTDKDTGKPFTTLAAAKKARAKELYEIELENKKVFIKTILRKFLAIQMLKNCQFRMSTIFSVTNTIIQT